MGKNNTLTRLETDLYHYMITEFCKKDPSKRNSTELYRYKGLSISLISKKGTNEHTLVVGIGALEAQFKVGSCDKVSGNLAPEEEKIIQIWMGQPEVNSTILTAVLSGTTEQKKVPIIPFDLEEFYA